MPSGRRRWARALGSLAVLVLGWSLLTGARSANEFLKAGDYPAAIAALRAEESVRPRSATVKRNLGIALLESGDAGTARAKLIEARELSPRDPLVLFFLGRAADRAGQSGEAIEAYRAYLGRGGREADAVRGRLRELTLASMKASARSAITAEKRLSADSIPSNTIAVPQFSTPSGVDSLVRLCRGLALVMTTDLSKVPSLRVVERERLGVLLDELRLGAAGGAKDPATPDAVSARNAPRVGLLVGARMFAQGGLSPLGGTEVQLDASLVDAKDGRSVGVGTPVRGALSDVLGLEKTLVYQMLDTLRVPVTPALRKAIGPPPTKSFKAFMVFCHGLDYEARGLTEQAGAAYDEAARLDPGFTMAQEYGDALEGTAADAAALETQLVSEASAGEDDFDDRLMRSAFETGFGPGPEGETRSGIDPRLVPSERTGSRRLIIRGTLK